MNRSYPKARQVNKRLAVTQTVELDILMDTHRRGLHRARKKGSHHSNARRLFSCFALLCVGYGFMIGEALILYINRQRNLAPDH